MRIASAESADHVSMARKRGNTGVGTSISLARTSDLRTRPAACNQLLDMDQG
jgi:hypothetical protein